ncbi:MAG: AEC family transporter [Prevotella sp.]|nr:AEC family transporter [Prevotella sp.]
MFVVMMTLFAIVVVGYAAGKMGYMGGDFDKKLSSLVINWTCPALILSSSMTGELPDRRFILPLLGISTLTYIVLTALAFWLPRFLTRRKEDEGIVGFALMFGNVGFMGYPVVASIFGHEAIFYAAVLNVVNTFTVFTVGTILIAGKSGGASLTDSTDSPVMGRRFQKKVLYSSPMLAAYLTMLIVALEIDNIPEVISSPLAMIGNITVPAALLIVGSSMSQLSLRALLGNTTVYATTVLRLAIIPLAVHLLCTLLGFAPFVVGINTVVIAMPVATYGTILCLKYGRDTTLIAEVTFITTVLSMLSIPLLVMVLNQH